MVDLPTATEPATPITNGVRCVVSPRKVVVAACSWPAVEVQEAGQGQIDLPHFLDVEGVAEATQAEHVLLIEGLLHLGSEPGPGLPVQLHERGYTFPGRFIALQSHT
jgi:hypothetical protein